EMGPVADLAEAAAGEEPERSGPARRPLEVRDEGRKRLPRARAPPRVERGVQLRGREVEGLAELRAFVCLAQATLELTPVRIFRPGAELVERQKRSPQDEEAGGSEVAAEAHDDLLACSMIAHARRPPVGSLAGDRALPAVASPNSLPVPPRELAS